MTGYLINYHITTLQRKKRDQFQKAETEEQIKEDITHYECLDKLITEAIVYAENDWSPRLIQAIQIKKYWRLLLKTPKGQPVAQSTIDLTRKAAGLPLYTPYIVEKL